MTERSAWGDYTEPGKEHARSRWLFLCAMHDHAREVLDEAGIAVLPIVRDAIRTGGAFYDARELVETFWGRTLDITEASSTLTHLRAVKQPSAVTNSESWMDRVRTAMMFAQKLEKILAERLPEGVQAPWVARAILDGAMCWARDPGEETERVWHYVEYTGPLPTADMAVSVNMSWQVDPFRGALFRPLDQHSTNSLRLGGVVGSLRDIEKAMMEDLRIQVQAGLRCVEEAAAKVGTRVEMTRREHRHYEWLVLRQVHRWTPARIGLERHASEGTVAQALSRLRASLELPNVKAEVYARPTGAPRGRRKRVKENENRPV